MATGKIYIYFFFIGSRHKNKGFKRLFFNSDIFNHDFFSSLIGSEQKMKFIHVLNMTLNAHDGLFAER